MRRAALAAVAGVTLVASAVSAAAAPPAEPVAPTPLARAVGVAASLVASRPAALHASADDVFVQKQAITGNAGLNYVPYERTHKGLPVVGGDFVVVTDSAGQVLNTSVAQEQTIALSTLNPLVRKQDAESAARGKLTRTDRVEGTRQVVYAHGTPKLAWETTVIGADKDGPSRQTVVVDAQTGAVLQSQERIMNGDGNTAWNGPKPVHLDTTKSGNNFLLRDPAHPTEQCQDISNNTTFSKTTDSWGNGDATSKETGCADTFFGMQTLNKMLSKWLGRNSFDGNGGGWPVRVGLNQQNAFYDGSQIQIGRNGQGQWISSLDVVAHEHGHGIDDRTPGGISGGGTQEFVADVFGAATEWFANEPAPYDVPDFTVGETINLVGRGPIRNMYNPSMVNNDPNCYSSSIPTMGVHKAAGPGNHWFYLVAMGSNPGNGHPTSPTCNNTTITGIGVETATKIFYNAMLMKTSGASYLRYRTWTLQAAKNMTPGVCTNFDVIKAAWNAVSVPAQSGEATCTPTNTGPTVTNPGSQSTVVNTAVNLQLSATGGTAPLHWTATGLPEGLSISDGGVISGTPTAEGSSSVTATATDSSSPAKSGSATFSWTVRPQSGTGPEVANPGAQTTEVNTAVNLQLSATGGTAPLHWTATGLPEGLSISDDGLISGTPTAEGSSSVTVTATDSSSPAKSGSATFSWTVTPGGGGCSAPAWNATTSYVPNDEVSHNGNKWTSTWYSTGAEPGDPTSWSVWRDGGAC
ncbi:peptidase M4 family protein [Actinosynnema sp. ALI-1.44]|uniref:putative Ig domain-containing protein n=1 Tax=Actinosynnema sp. ALI-1.44 TaxID=1933779 RepID=UPI00097C363A|nr:putative Ig domain-containing protein [Actinosynnema sp. ALI-1.44]ONI76107.1 peptidase M4 family protein [Actinosynnema sp. ALI-1.44]